MLRSLSGSGGFLVGRLVEMRRGHIGINAVSEMYITKNERGTVMQ